jgi:hypothetical protein
MAPRHLWRRRQATSSAMTTNWHPMMSQRYRLESWEVGECDCDATSSLLIDVAFEVIAGVVVVAGLVVEDVDEKRLLVMAICSPLSVEISARILFFGQPCAPVDCWSIDTRLNSKII